MWSSSSGPSRPINYGFPPEMGMLGLRDVFLVAPAAAYHNHPHHHHHHHHQQDLLSSDHNSMNGSNPATALGVGVIPLLTTTPCLGPPNTNMNDDNDDDDDDDHNMLSGRNRNSAGGGGGGSIHLWQQPTQQQHQLFLKKNQNLHGGAHLMVPGGGGNFGASAASASASASSALTCQDCGNQAKKDCSHRRCRTCCKSRGFDCATHVKSTWVPAARRRERQLMSEGVAAAAGSSASTSHTNNTSCNAKKPRLVTSQNTTPSHTNSTSNTTPPRSYDSTSKLQHQDGGFPETMPGQVRAPAVFKCVRVTAVDDGAEDEYAYHAVVKINGHVFKGFLYDQGVEGQGRDHHGFPNISDLHLGGRSGGATSTPTGRNGGAPILDPADAYAAAAAASTSRGLLLGGSNFGNSIN
ncbi:protein LATERAL ROOT PRIMORDIUM 1 isoform X1 [Rosa rugosa]|uniref:protein LATERAL ROOT PRIMORDIUM 1 isoform X1 n=1 Tax=Rosa rugosa TaxID=74645 RepID=UPI002B408397|nr:protein LATERAL ROOT PRIMORDIUM 1 isoform X1 [Rosa rugosa]XP_062015912.1 protein LATERAL ROOT PRIMORDIUM 1 isoform X1 [Rosa rugosa]